MIQSIRTRLAANEREREDETKMFLGHRFQQLDLEVKERRYAESGDEGDPGRWGPTASFSPNLELGDFAVCGIPSWRRQSSSEDNSISFRAGSARLPTIVTTPFCDSGDGFSNFLSSQKLGHDFVINDLFWPSCKPLCINNGLRRQFMTLSCKDSSRLHREFRFDLEKSGSVVVKICTAVS